MLAMLFRFFLLLAACASTAFAQSRSTTAAQSVAGKLIYIAHVTVIDTGLDCED